MRIKNGERFIESRVRVAIMILNDRGWLCEIERSPSGSAYINATHTIHGGDCLIRVSDHAARPSNRPKPQVDINPKKDSPRDLTEFLDSYRKVRREKKKRKLKKWCSRPHPDDVDDI